MTLFASISVSEPTEWVVVVDRPALCVFESVTGVTSDERLESPSVVQNRSVTASCVSAG